MEKKPQDTESRHADKYIVRFPDGMRDRLKAAAVQSSRTLNAEIVSRLQDSLDARETPQERILALHLAEAHDEIKRLKMTVTERSGASRQKELDLGLAPLKSELHQLREDVQGELRNQVKVILQLMKQGSHFELAPDGELVALPKRNRLRQPQSAAHVNIDPNAVPYHLDASAPPPRKRAPKK